MTLSTEQLLPALRNALPTLKIDTARDSIEQACTDWRKRYRTDALGVVFPENTDQVATIVRLCKAHGVAITTQGGNTGLVGGAVPVLHADRPHLLLSTRKLRDTLKVDKANLTITASAGFALQEIQQAADQAGYLFPLSLASEGSCTLGGNLASNAGGVAVLRYGNARELCLGLEFVSAAGERCGDLRGLRKNNTGYDLRHLLIGSEGTLGIITQACMKIFPKPKASAVAWMHVKDIHAAVRVLEVLQSQLFSEISSYEWMNTIAVGLVKNHFGYQAPKTLEHPDVEHVLVQFDSLDTAEALNGRVESVLESLLRNPSLGLVNVFLAQNLSESRSWWQIRESISEAQAREGLNVKHDVACAVSRLPEFHDKALAELRALALNIRPVLFGHLGDGNLHYNVSGPIDTPSQSFLEDHQEAISQVVYKVIQEVGGTVSAEHGIGQLKADLLKEITPPANYGLFKAVKQAMDPDGLLNPGKMLL